MSQTKAQLISDLVQALNFTGTASAPANGLFLSAANTLKLATASTERLKIDGTEVVVNDTGASVDFRVEGDTEANLLFVDASADRIGIGTSSPDTLFHVESTGATSTRLSGNRGDDNNLHIANIEFENTFNTQGVVAEIKAITGSSGTQSSLGQLTFSTDNGSSLSERVRIDSDGDVLVGLTTALSTQAGSIQAAGPIMAKSYINAHTSNATVIEYISNLSKIRAYGGTAGSGMLAFNVGGGGDQTDSEAMRIDSSGKLLLGNSSSEGSGKLQVFTKTADALDILSFDDTTADGGRLTFYRNRNTEYGSNTKVQENDSLGRIDFRGMNTEGTDDYEIGASIRAEVEGILASGSGDTADMPSRLMLFTSPGNSPEERVRIDSSGNVGIGETSPANLLHVKVDDAGIAPHGSAQIVLERAGTNYLQFLTANDGTSGLLFGDADDNDVTQIKYDHNTKKLFFLTETETAVTIDQNQNVGIGTTSPSATLHCVGGEIFFGDSNSGVNSTAKLNYGGSSGVLNIKASSTGGDTSIKLHTSNDGTEAVVMTISKTGLITAASGQHDGGLQLLSGSNNQSTRLQIQGKTNGGTAHLWSMEVPRGSDILNFFSDGHGSTFKLDESGHATVIDGDLVIGTAGHGINFSSATDVTTNSDNAGSVTVASSTLDDYEEGTFTPAVQFDSLSGSPVYGSRSGRYVKVGKKVTIIYYIEVDSGLSSADFFCRLALPFAGLANGHQDARVRQWNNIHSDWWLSLGGSGPVFFHSNAVGTSVNFARGDDVNGAKICGVYHLIVD